MSEQKSWYYVYQNDRKGPVPFEELVNLIKVQVLDSNSYVWSKGFENWKKLKDVEQLRVHLTDQTHTFTETKYQHYVMTKNLAQIEPGKRNIYIKTGFDRKGDVKEYGPFDIEMIRKLYVSKRINGKTLVYFPGLDCWRILGSFADYEDFFNEIPPVINEEERRRWERKPFTARLLLTAGSEDVLEGLCKDLSMGGMQILVDNFPAQVGDVIQMNVHPENEQHQFVAQAEVVRILDRDRGVSLKFVNLSDGAQQAIQSYLNERS